MEIVSSTNLFGACLMKQWSIHNWAVVFTTQLNLFLQASRKLKILTLAPITTPTEKKFYTSWIL